MHSSHFVHQLNMILDESSFNIISNTMVSEHIDYPICSYYMKNQHDNATYKPYSVEVWASACTTNLTRNT